jgi:pyruvate,water dikinase
MLTGSKARNLSLILNEGFRVPEGFCITTPAYQDFLLDNQLFQVIDQEISRKPPTEMRWEEIWDASLRIRSAFLKAPLPHEIEAELLDWLQSYPEGEKFSVRSSSPAEDSMKTSYAGIHDSYVNISGWEKIREAVKLVWASLWTDRAILYRDELDLDPLKSFMAVVIQRMEKQPVSGLAFSQDPTGTEDNLIIEAVEGLLSRLVDNEEEGEKWVIQRSNGQIVDHHQPQPQALSLLGERELQKLVEDIFKIEEIFKYPVDVEWTGTGREFTVLQVRPITSLEDHHQDRQWYLTLTPHFEELKRLSHRVEQELIPKLLEEGIRLSAEDTRDLAGDDLAIKLRERAKIYQNWKDIYWEDFIPFAHGIRNLGTYYNDLVKPDNPYEFLEIFKKEELLARERDAEFQKVARILKDNPALQRQVENLLSQGWKGKELLDRMGEMGLFSEAFTDLMHNHLDVSYQDQSLQNYPEMILTTCGTSPSRMKRGWKRRPRRSTCRNSIRLRENHGNRK